MIKDKWRAFFLHGGDKKRRVLVLVGVVGIALLALPELLPRGRERAAVAAGDAAVAAADIEAAFEKRITALLTQVEGVGDCRVMVTLENSAKAVYATQSTHNDTQQADGSNSASGSEEVLLVDTDTGPVGLLLTELQPSVKGVVVVCAGGGDPAVSEQVTQLVATAFHISSRRVCVAKQQ